MDSEADEITLPAQPCLEPALPIGPSSSSLSNKKRPFLRSRGPTFTEDQLGSLFHTSSDPALFSSDETPDAENYSPGAKRRKKKTYEGTWWGEKFRSARSSRDTLRNTTTKRQFRRNFDSGIFMCDDSSASDLSSGSSLEQELLDAQQRHGADQSVVRSGNMLNATSSSQLNTPHRGPKFTTKVELQTPAQTISIDPTHEHVAAVVQSCLRRNEENIDLTDLNLTSLPSVVTELKSMIKRIVASSEDAKLAPFEAELKVFLGTNNFTEFPSVLLELSNIQILSVRQNKLTDLPTGIRNLSNLKELNISSNNFPSLPFEVMTLLQRAELATIQSRPNPWTSLPATEKCLPDVPLPQILTKSLNYLRRVAVGNPVTFSPNGDRQPGQISSVQSKIPPLSELVLRALLRHNKTKCDLSPLLTEYDPESPKRLLRLLHSVQFAGGRQCTFCQQEIVLPHMQWTEWWDVHSILQHTWIHIDQKAPFGSENAIVHTQSCTPVEADNYLGDRILPFTRLSCGCVPLRDGLEMEAKLLRDWGHEVKTSIHDAMFGPASFATAWEGGFMRVTGVDPK